MVGEENALLQRVFGKRGSLLKRSFVCRMWILTSRSIGTSQVDFHGQRLGFRRSKRGEKIDPASRPVSRCMLSLSRGVAVSPGIYASKLLFLDKFFLAPIVLPIGDERCFNSG